MKLNAAKIIAFFLFSSSVCFCQKNSLLPGDPMLETNSEKWKVKENNKMFGGIAKPEFGPYTTTLADKLDTPVIKKRTSNGSEFELKIGYDAEMETGHQADLNMSKKVTIQKTKFYRLQLTNGADTMESLFSLFSTSVEKKQTLMGKMLSKKDDDKIEVLSYTVRINGMINTNTDSLPWKFFYSSVKPGNNNSFNTDTSQNNSGISGYLKNNNDSIHVEPIIYFFKSKLYSLRNTLGIALVNQKGEHLAALQFATPDSKSFIWIRKDFGNDYLRAIATFLDVIIAM